MHGGQESELAHGGDSGFGLVQDVEAVPDKSSLHYGEKESLTVGSLVGRDTSVGSERIVSKLLHLFNPRRNIEETLRAEEEAFSLVMGFTHQLQGWGKGRPVVL